MRISRCQLAIMLFILSDFIALEAITVFVKKADDKNIKKITNRVEIPKNHHGACKYARYCRYFDANSSVCITEDIASSYCGSYDSFDNFIIAKLSHFVQ